MKYWVVTKNGEEWVNGSLGRVVQLEEDFIEIELLGDEDLG